MANQTNAKPNQTNAKPNHHCYNQLTSTPGIVACALRVSFEAFNITSMG